MLLGGYVVFALHAVISAFMAANSVKAPLPAPFGGVADNYLSISFDNTNRNTLECRMNVLGCPIRFSARREELCI